MGVKSLWTLLEPVGRRINIEALRNKRMAVDASIWVYQFMQAMRDDRGEMLRNAHLHGFFHRTCRLLYHRIRPVFVFDGATPALKRQTTAARRRRREQQHAKLRRTAEKLLLNQLKQHALGRLGEAQAAAAVRGGRPEREIAEDRAGAEGTTGSEARPASGGPAAHDGAAAPGDGAGTSAAAAASQEPRTGGDELLAAQLAALDWDDDDAVAAAVAAAEAAEQHRQQPIVQRQQQPTVQRKQRGEQPQREQVEAGEGTGPEGGQEEQVVLLDVSDGFVGEDERRQEQQLQAPPQPQQGEAGSSDDELEMVLPQSGELDPAVLSTLPPSLQLDLLLRLREQKRTANREAFESRAGKPASFSAFQMEQYLATTERRMDEVKDTMNAAAGGAQAARRIAAEAGREYVLHKEGGQGAAQGAERADEEHGSERRQGPAALPGARGQQRRVQEEAASDRLPPWAPTGPGRMPTPLELLLQRDVAAAAAATEKEAPAAAAGGPWGGALGSAPLEISFEVEVEWERSDTGARWQGIEPLMSGMRRKCREGDQQLWVMLIAFVDAADDDLMWEDVEVEAAATGGAPEPEPQQAAGQLHWRERAAQRQKYWSLSHGFKGGRKLAAWGQAEDGEAAGPARNDASVAGRLLPHGSSPVKATPPGAAEEDEDAQLQEAIRLSLLEGPEQAEPQRQPGPDAGVQQHQPGPNAGVQLPGSGAHHGRGTEVVDLVASESDSEAAAVLASAAPPAAPAADGARANQHQQDLSMRVNAESLEQLEQWLGSGQTQQSPRQSEQQQEQAGSDVVEWEDVGPSAVAPAAPVAPDTAATEAPTQPQRQAAAATGEAEQELVWDVHAGCARGMCTRDVHAEPLGVEAELEALDVPSSPAEARMATVPSPPPQQQELCVTCPAPEEEQIQVAVPPAPTAAAAAPGDTSLSPAGALAGVAEQRRVKFGSTVRVRGSEGEQELPRMLRAENPKAAGPEPRALPITASVPAAQGIAAAAPPELPAVVPAAATALPEAAGEQAGGSTASGRAGFTQEELQQLAAWDAQEGWEEDQREQQAAAPADAGPSYQQQQQQQSQQPPLWMPGDDREAELASLQQEEGQLRAKARAQKGQTETPTGQMYQECQELLTMFGLPYIIAPTEAEAQCAWLEHAGLVDGVITDDNDAFLFGGQRVYRHIFEGKQYAEEYRASDLASELGLDRERLVALAQLLGGDYCEGVPGVGVVNAMEVVRAFPGLEGLRRFKEWVESPDEQLVELAKGGSKRRRQQKRKTADETSPALARAQGKHSRRRRGPAGSGMEGQEAEVEDRGQASAGAAAGLGSEEASPAGGSQRKECSSQAADEAGGACEQEPQQEDDEAEALVAEFKRHHRGVRRSWELPPSFPSATVAEAYLQPRVDTSRDKFTFGRPDAEELRVFCEKRLGMSAQQAEQAVAPVVEAFERREAQQTLDQYLAFSQRFAKIKSKRLQKAVAGIAGGARQEVMLLGGEGGEAAQGARPKKRKKQAAQRQAAQQEPQQQQEQEQQQEQQEGRQGRPEPKHKQQQGGGRGGRGRRGGGRGGGRGRAQARNARASQGDEPTASSGSSEHGDGAQPALCSARPRREQVVSSYAERETDSEEEGAE
eukprot:scaffold21.g2071.t1